MTALNHIVSIEIRRMPPAAHDVVVAVTTHNEAAAADQRWTVRAVLDAMNRAERFYTRAPNGRHARVQRYACAGCRQEHIRTHVSDRAIDELMTLPRTGQPPRSPALAPGAPASDGPAGGTMHR